MSSQKLIIICYITSLNKENLTVKCSERDKLLTEKSELAARLETKLTQFSELQERVRNCSVYLRCLCCIATAYYSCITLLL